MSRRLRIYFAQVKVLTPKTKFCNALTAGNQSLSVSQNFIWKATVPAHRFVLVQNIIHLTAGCFLTCSKAQKAKGNRITMLKYPFFMVFTLMQDILCSNARRNSEFQSLGLQKGLLCPQNHTTKEPFYTMSAPYRND